MTNDDLCSQIVATQTRLLYAKGYLFKALDCISDVLTKVPDEFSGRARKSYDITDDAYKVITIVIGGINDLLERARAGEIPEDEAENIIIELEQFRDSFEQDIQELVSIEEINYH